MRRPGERWHPCVPKGIVCSDLSAHLTGQPDVCLRTWGLYCYNAEAPAPQEGPPRGGSVQVLTGLKQEPANSLELCTSQATSAGRALRPPFPRPLGRGAVSQRRWRLCWDGVVNPTPSRPPGLVVHWERKTVNRRSSGTVLGSIDLVA